MTTKRPTLATTLTTVLLLLLVTNNSWGKATATVDRNPVNIDESFILTLQSDNGGYFSDDPDLSAISKDFNVLSQSENQQISYINGSSTKIKSWQLKLSAKKTGRFTLPSIVLNDENTAPLLINVVEPTALANGQGQRQIFVEASADLNTVYIQSPFTYTILIATSLPLAGGSELNAPDFGSAFSEQLEDRRYEKIINGINYTMIERRYIVFPQSEGELEIAPTVLRAKIATGRRSAFGYNQSKDVTRRSDMTTVNVIGKPDSYPASDWLPAKKLVLSQQWSQPPELIKVGDSITRTIKIQAQGLTAAQLPPLFLPEIKGVSLYADKPVINSHISADDIIGERIESYAIIATETGEVTLPAIQIHWWNTLSNRLETAELEATTITVTGDSAGAMAIAATNNTPANKTDKPEKNVIKTDGDILLWQTISAVLAALWLLTIALSVVLYRKKPTVSNPPTDQTAVNNTSTSLRQLTKSCHSHDAQRAADDLLHWARAQWPQATLNSLNQVAAQAPPLQQAIDTLQASLYGSAVSTWQGDSLLAAVNNCSTPATASGSDLDPLYPA
jgi:hypothetical protein